MITVLAYRYFGHRSVAPFKWERIIPEVDDSKGALRKLLRDAENAGWVSAG
jgi:hypothetical protein